MHMTEKQKVNYALMIYFASEFLYHFYAYVNFILSQA